MELLSMKGIEKSFGKNNVLKKVKFQVNKGEIHALMGENGAGKSTLMKILGGVIEKDKGHINFDGQTITKMTPELAKELGIGFVHQELNLADSLSVAENIFMGRLPIKNTTFNTVDFNELYSKTQSLLNLVGAKFTPQTQIHTLSTANKQLVEIAKALSLQAKVIIFDEPTTSLSSNDVEVLFIIIRALKEKGISSVYISHRMAEIFELCERITIMRDGTYISTDYIKDLTKDEVISRLVGRELSDMYPKTNVDFGEKLIEVQNLSDTKGFVKNINFHAKKGEVVGFAGLVGAGRTEVMRLLFGADKASSGEIFINQKPVAISSPIDAIKNGIAFLTEDRKHQGLALNLSICDNVSITNLGNMIINHKQLHDTCDKFINDLQIKVSNKHLPASSLSGGNQQKVVLAKWLNTNSHIYIFDEPTKGIDVGAKAEIYQIINNLAKQGKTVLVVSSEIPELLNICDRIYVLNEGEITGEMLAKDADSENIMRFAITKQTNAATAKIK